MSTVAQAPAAALFREVSCPTANESTNHGRLLPRMPAGSPKPAAVRRWVDVTLVSVAAGVWFHILAVVATGV
jgi:hypothetical protein